MCNNIYLSGTEELAHIEMICAMIYQLTENAGIDDIENTPFAPYYIDHTKGIWPQSAGGTPWSATTFQSKGDPITDMHEDMAAEQKARTTYDNILRLAKGTCIYEPIKFLRAREIAHFQRFGEALRIVQDNLDAKNFYALNPSFDYHGLKDCKKKEKSCNCSGRREQERERQPEMMPNQSPCFSPDNRGSIQELMDEN